MPEREPPPGPPEDSNEGEHPEDEGLEHVLEEFEELARNRLSPEVTPGSAVVGHEEFVAWANQKIEERFRPLHNLFEVSWEIMEDIIDTNKIIERSKEKWKKQLAKHLYNDVKETLKLSSTIQKIEPAEAGSMKRSIDLMEEEVRRLQFYRQELRRLVSEANPNPPDQ